jgi:hypothetical protein
MVLQPLIGPWQFFSVSWSFYTVCTIPWTGDQPVARPLPAHRTAQTQNKRTQTSMPQMGFEPRLSVFDRAKKVHALRPRGHCDRPEYNITHNIYDVYNVCIIYVLPNIRFDSVLSAGDQRTYGYSADRNRFSPDLNEYFWFGSVLHLYAFKKNILELSWFHDSWKVYSPFAETRQLA